MYTTELYFEAHITVRFNGNDYDKSRMWNLFVDSAELNGWRASKFDVDEVDHYDGAWFLSAREVSYDELMRMMKEEVEVLTESGTFEFIRAKIENTLFDTKHGDVL